MPNLLVAVVAGAWILLTACPAVRQPVVAPGEFEPQEYVWLSWVDEGFLGGEPFATTAAAVMREITPSVKVRLLYGDDGSGASPAVAARAITERLLGEGIDISRVELVYYPMQFGSIQDPGPFFLLRADGGLAVADYRYNIVPEADAMDRDLAERLGLPVVSTDLASEGGGRQSNGLGTVLLVEAVERERNPGWTLREIEAEHRRVLGATNIIWLPNGLKEESWGQLENGLWGIGTGGHIDTFSRFAGPNTILLAEVNNAERDADPVLRESYERMEENYRILRGATDQDGNPFEIIRVPIGPRMTKVVQYDGLSRGERTWFAGAGPGDEMEFYLTTGYLNFIIANDVVVTSRYWREGLSEALRERDEQAREALQQAFPGRRIVQVDSMPLHYDGAGLHCHSRNQPLPRRDGG